jgi:predicted transcriptional regulator
MHVMLRSDDNPDTQVNGEICNLQQLDRHIRTLLAARRWLKAECQRLKSKVQEKAK